MQLRELKLRPCPECGRAIRITKRERREIWQRHQRDLAFQSMVYCEYCGFQGPAAFSIGQAMRKWNLQALLHRVLEAEPDAELQIREPAARSETPERAPAPTEPAMEPWIPYDAREHFLELLADPMETLALLLQKLNQQQRRYVELHCFEGLTFREVADRVHRSVERVRQVVYKGLRLMREEARRMWVREGWRWWGEGV